MRAGLISAGALATASRAQSGHRNGQVGSTSGILGLEILGEKTNVSWYNLNHILCQVANLAMPKQIYFMSKI